MCYFRNDTTIRKRFRFCGISKMASLKEGKKEKIAKEFLHIIIDSFLYM